MSNIENYYLTPREFADIIVEIVEEQYSFPEDKKMHPEDIEVAFSNVAFSVAKGITFVTDKNMKQKYSYTFTSNATDKTESMSKKWTELNDKVNKVADELKNKIDNKLSSHNINNYSEWKKENSTL